MTRTIVAAAMERAPRAKKKKKATHWKTYLFVALMLVYPIVQFLIMWLGVNINSIFLTFKTFYNGTLVWVFEDPTKWSGDMSTFWSTLFYNYVTLFGSFSSSDVQSMFSASLVYFVISCLVTLPIALFFSYFIFKKIIGNSFFKIIFFLPCILPLFILTMVYSLALSSNGLVAGVLDWFQIDYGNFFNNLFIGGNARWMVWIFCIWAGIGYDVILLTAGMSRIPRDILESCKMDGVSPMKEFLGSLSRSPGQPSRPCSSSE